MFNVARCSSTTLPAPSLMTNNQHLKSLRAIRQYGGTRLWAWAIPDQIYPPIFDTNHWLLRGCGFYSQQRYWPTQCHQLDRSLSCLSAILSTLCLSASYHILICHITYHWYRTNPPRTSASKIHTCCVHRRYLVSTVFFLLVNGVYIVQLIASLKDC
jgi:hypothetical protein